jgi:hypothetical protein
VMMPRSDLSAALLIQRIPTGPWIPPGCTKPRRTSRLRSSLIPASKQARLRDRGITRLLSRKIALGAFQSSIQVCRRYRTAMATRGLGIAGLRQRLAIPAAGGSLASEHEMHPRGVAPLLPVGTGGSDRVASGAAPEALAGGVCGHPSSAGVDVSGLRRISAACSSASLGCVFQLGLGCSFFRAPFAVLRQRRAARQVHQAESGDGSVAA